MYCELKKDKEKRSKLCLSELSRQNGRYVMEYLRYDTLAVFLICNITRRQIKEPKQEDGSFILNHRLTSSNIGQ